MPVKNHANRDKLDNRSKIDKKKLILCHLYKISHLLYWIRIESKFYLKTD